VPESRVARRSSRLDISAGPSTTVSNMCSILPGSGNSVVDGG
jgi:hypothetical protein